MGNFDNLSVMQEVRVDLVDLSRRWKRILFGCREVKETFTEKVTLELNPGAGGKTMVF